MADLPLLSPDLPTALVGGQVATTATPSDTDWIVTELNRLGLNINELGAGWANYPSTPTWGNSGGGGTPPAIGNGTLRGKYKQTGKHIEVVMTMATGSTTTYGAGAFWKWSLPTGNAAIEAYVEYPGPLFIATNSGFGAEHWTGTSVVHGALDGGTTPEIRAVTDQCRASAFNFTGGGTIGSNPLFGVVAPSGHNVSAGDQFAITACSDATWATGPTGQGIYVCIDSTATGIRATLTTAMTLGTNRTGTIQPAERMGIAYLGTAMPLGWFTTTLIPNTKVMGPSTYFAMKTAYDLA